MGRRMHGAEYTFLQAAPMEFPRELSESDGVSCYGGYEAISREKSKRSGVEQ